MKADLYTKVILSLIGAVLCAMALNGLFVPKTVQADPPPTGRYEISAWATPVGPLGHHSGYYVLDTSTGKVVESHEDVHPAGINEAAPHKPAE